MSLVGLDVGTTGSKAVAFDLEGKIIAQAYREYPLIHIKPGWIELDPHVIWNSVKAIISEVGDKTKHDPIKALAISALGETVTPIGKNGEVLYNSLSNLDTRTEYLMPWWKKKLGKEKIFMITGMPLQAVYTINKIMWWKKHKPEVYKKTWKFLCYEDYMYYKLGLKPTMDYTLASRTMAFDIRKKCWSEKILNCADISPDLLADVKPSGEIVGEIPENVRSELGLQEKVVVVTGAHDQPAGALGAGIIKDNIAMDATGTVECITPSFSKPVLTKTMLKYNYCCAPHSFKGRYVTLAYNLTGGSIVRWYRDNFAHQELHQAKQTGEDVYDIIFKNFPQEPTDIFVLPHFTATGTPWSDSDATGAILGLSLSTKRQELIKAFVEGVCYEMKLNIEFLEKAGIKIKELRAIGGGAKSPVWLQLKADIFNKKIISLNVTEAACLGMAMLAGVAVGEYKSLTEAVENLIKVRQTFLPQKKKAEIYQNKYKIYKKIYPLIKSIGVRKAESQ